MNVSVKRERFSKRVQQDKKQDEDTSNIFVFCEKTTGVAQFRTESEVGKDGVDRIAGLLAMQCLVRGQEPADFQVLVPAQKTFEGQVVARAQELLEEGRALACPASLSPRQKEILHSVLCNRANKEIASRLNITVRTVKFHISTLLTKFGVTNRADLARRAAGLVRPGGVAETDALEHSALEKRASDLTQRVMPPMTVSAGLRVASKTRTTVFPAPLLSA